MKKKEHGPSVIEASTADSRKYIEEFFEERGSEHGRATQTMLAVFRINYALIAVRENTAKEFDLTANAVIALTLLRACHNKHVITPTDLCTRVGMTTGGMTKNLDRLEARGLIVRSGHATDLRRCEVTLTDKGLELIDHLLPVLEERDAEVLYGALTPAEIEQFDAAIGKVAELAFVPSRRKTRG